MKPPDQEEQAKSPAFEGQTLHAPPAVSDPEEIVIKVGCF
jgi:hypothetical protein